MSDLPFQTVHLQRWMERMRAGDQLAQDELLQASCEQLERLSSRMLKKFPGVGRWEQTGDVLQNSLLRLTRALEQVTPTTTREYLGLAALQIRRELLDLCRRYQAQKGIGANHASNANLPQDGAAWAADPASEASRLDDDERWAQFHQEVEQLPVEEREAVGLLFYHGWPQEQAAELLQVDVRTIRRRWQQALRKLRRLLQDEAAGGTELGPA